MSAASVSDREAPILSFDRFFQRPIEMAPVRPGQQPPTARGAYQAFAGLEVVMKVASLIPCVSLRVSPGTFFSGQAFA
jgi:hypothetical protein